ncbi:MULTISPECIES: FAD-binding oxidoreductase [Clostridium]|uniref:Putative FAD-linked oxidoreductase n=1 Tax=Clostridium ragsdalei P11 TaxID=1353534 RepID=A0A1A6AX42_9CLOT|nr:MULTISPECIES: FAD-binding oxidoreductase [Clostridium]OBR94656.1 putative FAD-linked oxidoreductase [Clostridium ragsdalei P11]QXE20626.1 FAD-binding oxidoreductase [Clostridium sp. 001]
MEQGTIDYLINTVGSDFVITDPEQKLSYMYDEIEHNVRPKVNMESVVVKPLNSKEISEIVKYAGENKIPIVVHGGGTGLCGGASPIKKSIVISMERMNKIIEIDEKNMMAVAEAGVTLAQLIEELENHSGICFPVHPGDEGAQMGGMVATNAGGARAVKHGIMRNHIKGIEVVLPNGEILNLGGKLLKDNTGYNLLQLIMGSEGTLAIITKITFRLYPEDKFTASIVLAFENISDASNAVLEIMKNGVAPLAVEYQDRYLNVKSAEILGLHWPLDKGMADLLIILSEKSEEALYASCQIINNVCKKYNASKAVFAGTKKEQAEMLAIRSGSYEVIKENIAYSFDMAVPAGYMPDFLNDLWKLVDSYGTNSYITAHLADGNVHNDIYMVDGKNPEYLEELKMKMYKLCFKYGGTLTGEHGIGKLRIKDLTLQKSKAEIELMKSIKRAFDPNNILNPGTVLEM